MNIDLVTVLTFLGGLTAPVAVLALFNRIAVKLSLPTIIDALMESVAFSDRIAAKMARHPEIECAMKGAADHKARNLEALWGNQIDMLRMTMDHNLKEERQWREFTSRQIDHMAKTVEKLVASVAHSQGQHSIQTNDSEERP